MPAAIPSKPAPLDPFVDEFLRWMADQPDGFTRPTDNPSLGASFDWPEPFVDVVFTCSRVRRLIEPATVPAGRGRVRWTLSQRGRVWLQRACVPRSA